MRGTLAIALLLALSPAASAQSTEGRVTVELSSFKFTPKALTLRQGQRYRLHLVNTASGGHDFVAKEFFAASTIAPEDRDKIRDGRIDLHGEEAVDVILTPNRAGTYKVHCSHFMHSTFGMTGEIVVQ